MPLVEALLTTIATSAAERIGSAFADKIAGLPFKITVRTQKLPEALTAHVEDAIAWGSRVNIPTIRRDHPLQQLFEDLDVNAVPRDVGEGRPADRSYRVSQLLKIPNHLVLLGGPGAGKTTAVKRLIGQVWDRVASKADTRIPIVVQCRNLKSKQALIAGLQSVTGLDLAIPETLALPATQPHLRQAMATALEALGAVLFVDGLDELDMGIRDDVWADLSELTLRCKNTKVVVTSRTGGFVGHFDNSKELELAPLSEGQIRGIVGKWLGPDVATRFVTELRGKRYAGTGVRPLALVHLCDYFERRGSFPERPRAVYRTITQLFCDRWDDYRQVRRKTEFTAFDADRKHEFLQHLSFELAVAGHRGAFTHEAVSSVYLKICDRFDLPLTGVDRVLREIESHTGLVVRAGSERYEFFHLTLQEYLAGEFLSRSRYIAPTLDRIPNEYAVAVAMSGDPVEFLTQLCIDTRLFRALTRTAVDAFFTRLIEEGPNWRQDRRLGAIFCKYGEYVCGSEREYQGGGRSSVALQLSEVLRASVRDFLQQWCTPHRFVTGLRMVTVKTDDSEEAQQIAAIIGDAELGVPRSWGWTHG